jgi:hypothetical protein
MKTKKSAAKAKPKKFEERFVEAMERIATSLEAQTKSRLQSDKKILEIFDEMMPMVRKTLKPRSYEDLDA